MLYLYHHLGLGDHIICNGMVRYFANLFDEIVLFCHPHNEKNLKYMFRDDLRINLFPMIESQIPYFLNNCKEKYIKIGFENIPPFENTNYTFDEVFYILAGLDFSVRFNNFKLVRDLQEEEKVFKELNPQNEKYIFICDDSERGYNLDKNKYRNDLKIIKNRKDINIFNLLKILEEAEEIHTMQTSIIDLCNSFKFLKSNIFLHSYVRKYSDFLHTKGLNPIRKIE